MAEVIQTEPSCTYSVAHQPDSDVAAEDLNGPIRLPPLEIELRRYIPASAGWFLDAALGSIRIDLATGAVSGPDGRALTASSQAAGCD